MDTKKIQTIKEFLETEFPPQKWLIKNLFIEGGLSLISAKPKVGKTHFSQFIISCLAKGINFYTHEDSEPKTILLYSLEEIPRELQRRFLEFELDGSERLFIQTSAPRNPIEQLREDVKSIKPDFVVIDTLGAFSNIKDFNDYGQVNNKLNKYREISKEFNAHICIITHEKKGDNNSIDSILGSTAITGGVDNIIQIKRNDKERFINVTNRYGEDIERTELIFDKENFTFRFGNTQPLKNTRETIKEEILKFLVNQTKPLTREEIEKSVKGRASTKREIIDQLTVDDHISRSGAGIKNDPHKYQILPVQMSHPKETDNGQERSDTHGH